jgi:TrpR-related protein YerC/YecD
MSTTMREIEPVAGLDDLADAVLSLRDRDEARRFLRDLCTLPELEALAHRWQTVRLLEQGIPYVACRRARPP